METGDKVTSDALRAMAVGKTVAFRLPTNEHYLSRAVNSGKAIAYRLQRELCCKFSTVADYDNATLIITKKNSV